MSKKIKRINYRYLDNLNQEIEQFELDSLDIETEKEGLTFRKRKEKELVEDINSKFKGKERYLYSKLVQNYLSGTTSQILKEFANSSKLEKDKNIWNLADFILDYFENKMHGAYFLESIVVDLVLKIKETYNQNSWNDFDSFELGQSTHEIADFILEKAIVKDVVLEFSKEELTVEILRKIGEDLENENNHFDKSEEELKEFAEESQKIKQFYSFYIQRNLNKYLGFVVIFKETKGDHWLIEDLVIPFEGLNSDSKSELLEKTKRDYSFRTQTRRFKYKWLNKLTDYIKDLFNKRSLSVKIGDGDLAIYQLLINSGFKLEDYKNGVLILKY